MHRFQISVFGSVAIVFAVIGVNQGIFTGVSSLDAMAAGWLILAIVDILWVLFFTSEEDSLAFHIFNSLGTGGLTPPSRRRRTRTTSVMNMGNANGYTAGYGSGGINPMYDTKMTGSMGGNSFRPGSMEAGVQRSGTGSVNNLPSGGGPGSIGGADSNVGPTSPLMGSGAAGVGAGGGPGPGSPGPTADTTSATENHVYRAKALYSCEHLPCHFILVVTFFGSDTASSDDPNEISFSKGELLEIVDKQGKWWQAKKTDGSVGSESRILLSRAGELTASISCTLKLSADCLMECLDHPYGTMAYHEQSPHDITSH
ncbi:High osmolarity signaling protein SHO1 [Grifola frondosa]|uniref:High osmolarity signaling protein SHO1 n=1 Tax=Grifola frondosa TaxID=5627 RepID=A0A1C7LUG3_GRIFR|nr:High osmolarity signaling protein SHO1 [Grifola frondosa]